MAGVAAIAAGGLPTPPRRDDLKGADWVVETGRHDGLEKGWAAARSES